MKRTFEEHKVRPVHNLDGLWAFHTVDDAGGEGRQMHLMVPGSWESHPDLCAYRGRGVYRREIELSAGANLLLHFEGVSHTAEVLLDGEWIPTRIELGEFWYLKGVKLIKLNGLIVRIED